MYQYDDIENTKLGGIVECTTSDTSINVVKETLYIITNVKGSTDLCYIDDKGNKSNGILLDKRFWKLVKTKPGSEAKIGDTVIRVDIPPIKTYFKRGHIAIVSSKTENSNLLHLGAIGTYMSRSVRVLCQEESKPETKRNLAFYKESGEPWTDEEYNNIIKYTNTNKQSLNNKQVKFIYDLGLVHGKDCYSSWTNQNHPNFNNCKQVSYESVFGPTISIDTSDSEDVSAYILYSKQPDKEEETMNPVIKLEINGKNIDVCKHESAACLKPKTDLESKLPFAMVIYKEDGSYETIKYNKTLKGLKKRKDKYLQKPANLGKTVTLHSFIDAFTTNIPVVKVK